jgi:outer membrane protein assembly factor BamB
MSRLAVFLALAALLALATLAVADDWPQWLGPQRDGVWRETGILTKFPNGGPKARWRTPIGGGYAGPAVANGRVYVHDRQLAEGVSNPASQFGRGNLAGSERVLCLDVSDGKVLWKHEYPCVYRISYAAGPRCTPVVHDGKVYSLGAMGDLCCLNASDGRLIWSRSFTKDYGQKAPQWGWSSHPLVDGDKLICLVGGNGSTVVAFHKDTGKELWRALDSDGDHGPGYSPPMICEAADKRQLIVWHPEAVDSLDPETGKVYWSQAFPLKSGLSVPMPRKDGDRLFVTAFYNGPLMLKFDRSKPAASVLWKGKSESEMNTDGLHSIIPTPVIKEGYIYGVCSYGQLRCLKADTGERVWETFKATTGAGPVRWSNAFLIPHEDRFFLFNEHGDLIIAKLTPKGYEELDRARILEATGRAGMGRRPDAVVWSHPAFANKCLFARNDKEIVCVSLAKE